MALLILYYRLLWSFSPFNEIRILLTGPILILNLTIQTPIIIYWKKDRSYAKTTSINLGRSYI